MRITFFVMFIVTTGALSAVVASIGGPDMRAGFFAGFLWGLAQSVLAFFALKKSKLTETRSSNGE